MSKILIIGGCGYIGSKLYIELSKEFNVDTVDIEWFGNNINPRNFKVDYNQLNKKFLSSYKDIILLAGHSSVAMCENYPVESFSNNVEKFITLLSKIENQKFIYASSSGVYGKVGKKMAEENDDMYTPTCYYDLTKKTIDNYVSLGKINYFGLRFGTVNGGSPNLRVDLMINKMYHSAFQYGKIEIQNSNVYRPILGINDLCRAVKTIISSDKRPGIYNLASYNKTVEDIAQEVARSIRSVDLIIHKEKVENIYNFTISTKKFEKEFLFTFKDTTKSIVASLSNYYKTCLRSERTK